ncbi:MAG: glutamate--tRNA ligase family protein [Flavobacteriales bacterium]
MRTRIAPTPSGYLHEGNAINFSAIWQLAQAHGGHILLRIDDLDAERTRPAYVEDIFRTLDRLGIAWHEGPSGPDDFHREWSQHLRMDLYHEVLERLRKLHLIYACHCSRSDVAAHSPDGRYPGTCRALGKPLTDDTSAWRLNLAGVGEVGFLELGEGRRSVALGAVMGDPVVRTRANGKAAPRPSYQIASLVDDVHFGINTIVRGIDLLPSTACQMHIADVLHVGEFHAASFLHHALSTDANGRKLSKSAGDGSPGPLSGKGLSTAAIHAAARSLLTARGLPADAG